MNLINHPTNPSFTHPLAAHNNPVITKNNITSESDFRKVFIGGFPVSITDNFLKRLFEVR